MPFRNKRPATQSFALLKNKKQKQKQYNSQKGMVKENITKSLSSCSSPSSSLKLSKLSKLPKKDSGISTKTNTYSLFDEDSPLANINNYKELPSNSSSAVYDFHNDLKFQRQLRLIQLDQQNYYHHRYHDLNGSNHNIKDDLNYDSDFSTTASSNNSSYFDLDLDLDLDIDSDLKNLDLGLNMNLELDAKIDLKSPLNSPNLHKSNKFDISIPIQESELLQQSNDLLSSSSSFILLNTTSKKTLTNSIYKVNNHQFTDNNDNNNNNNNNNNDTTNNNDTPDSILLSEFLNIDQSNSSSNIINSTTPLISNQPSTPISFKYRQNNTLSLTKDIQPPPIQQNCKRALKRLAIWSGKAQEMVLDTSFPIDEFII
jgi:hypothetical protein